KTGAHFKQTRYASQNPYASLRWFGDPAQELEQRGLAGTIATDDANHVAPPDFETHVSKRPEFFQHVTLDYGLAAKNVSRLLPDAVRAVHQHVPEGYIPAVIRLMADDVFLAKVFGFDNDVAHRAATSELYTRSANVFSIFRN